MKKNKKKYNEYKVGDIFSMELVDGEYAFGKILLDIYPLFKRRILDKESPLYFGNEHTIFIEVYKNTSNDAKEVPTNLEVLIPGIITNNIDLLLGKWVILKNEDIDPKELDFPEFVTHRGTDNSNFIKGEIKTTIKMSYEEAEELHIYQKELGCRNLNDVILYQLGRQEEMNVSEENRKSKSLENLDLRFSPHREKIMKMLPEIFKKKYHLLATEKGYSIERLYKK